MRVSTVTAPVYRCAGAEPRLRLGPVLGVLFAILYAYFLTLDYYWDGVSFAIDIEKARTFRDLFQVHHLLYNFIGYGEYCSSAAAYGRCT